MRRSIGVGLVGTLLMAATAMGGSPEWLNDYGTALEQTKATGKPLLIVLEDASEPARQLTVSHTTDAQRDELLSHYQLCRVNVSTAYGQAVAKAFQATQFPYTVVIDKTGSYQIFKKTGAFATSEWASTLTRYQEGTLQAEPALLQYPSRSFGSGTVCRT